MPANTNIPNAPVSIPYPLPADRLDEYPATAKLAAEKIAAAIPKADEIIVNGVRHKWGGILSIYGFSTSGTPGLGYVRDLSLANLNLPNPPTGFRYAFALDSCSASSAKVQVTAQASTADTTGCRIRSDISIDDAILNLLFQLIPLNIKYPTI